MGPSPQLISTLQAGRAAAALAVVIYHAGAVTAERLGGMPSLLNTVILRGHLGVDFFFVLSGFIIYHVNYAKEPSAAWSRRYFESRLVRIFVPYLPIGIALGLAYLWLPEMRGSARDWSWFATLTLLPTVTQPALLVAWTLQHELVFYALFWLFAVTRRPILCAGIWAALILLFFASVRLVGMANDPDLGPVRLTFLLGLINIEFVFGMVAAHLFHGGRVDSRILVGVGTASLLLFAVLGAGAELRILFGLGVALLLVPVVRAEQARATAMPPVLVRLGDASYAIYLVHFPLLVMLGQWLPPHWGLALVWLFCAGAAAGWLYHSLYERRAIAKARTALKLLGAHRRRETSGAT